MSVDEKKSVELKPEDAPIYIFLAIDVHDKETYAKYSSGAFEFYKNLKFEFLGNENENSFVLYEGELPANHFALIKFESKNDYDEFFNSEGYQKVRRDFRLPSSTTRFIVGLQPIKK